MDCDCILCRLYVDFVWIVERMEIKCRLGIHFMQSVFYKSYMDCIGIVCGLFLECVWIV